MNTGAVRLMGLGVAMSMVFSGFAMAEDFEDGPRKRGRRGGGQRLMGMVHVLEYLSSETAPGTFTVDLFPGQDTDGDGTLSDAEWTAFASNETGKIVDRLVKRAPEADVDADGTLSSVELQAFVDEKVDEFKERLLEHRPQVDADGDGELSDAEFAALEDKKLEHILDRHPESDLNSDGTLTHEEATAARLSKEIRFGPKREGRGGFRGKRGAEGRRGGGFRGGRGR